MSHRTSSTSALALSLTLSLCGCGGGGGGGGAATQSLLPPDITTSTFPDGTAGASYHAPLAASHGTDPISWRVAPGGTLPPGLAILPSRGRRVALEGTPTASGRFAFTIEAEDGSGASARRALTIDVFDALAISTASLAAAESHDPYSETIQAAGGQAPFTWSVVAGALPAGLTLAASTSASVALQGTTPARGGFTFTVSVRDASGGSAQRQLTLSVEDIERFVFGGNLEVIGIEQIHVTERVNGAPGTPRILIENTVGVGNASMWQALPVEVSPDGRFVATIMDREVPGAFDLYVADLRGPNQNRIRRVNNGLAGVAGRNVQRLFWSPDSRRIAFVGDMATAGVTDLFVADVTVASAITPRNVTQYVSGQGLSYWDTAFTSDGRHLVFIGDANPNPTANPSGFTHQLFFADLASPAPTAVRLSKPLSDPANMDVEVFAVAASGSGIAYRGDLETDGVQDIYHVTLAQGAAGATRRVTDAATAREFVGGPWLSPDGARLVFTSEKSSSLTIDPNWVSYVPAQLPYVVDLRAASPSPALLGAAVDGQAQRPVWSPDGASVLLYRQPDDGAGYVGMGGELHLVDATSGATTRINAASWDGITDVALDPMMFTPVPERFAYDFSPDGSALFYKQQTMGGGGISIGWGPPPSRYDVFLVELSGATPAAPVQASPIVAGLTDGGADGEVRFSPDSSKLSIVFRNNVAGGLIEAYVVYDVVLGGTTIAGSTVLPRLNNNAPGPKWTPGGRGLVISGPFEASSVAYNEVYFLDLVGGRQKLTPSTVRVDGDINDFCAID